MKFKAADRVLDGVPGHIDTGSEAVHSVVQLDLAYVGIERDTATVAVLHIGIVSPDREMEAVAVGIELGIEDILTLMQGLIDVVSMEKAQRDLLS